MMYDVVHRHGHRFITDSDRLLENARLKKENQELKKELEKYHKIHNTGELNYIDGHICYREVKDVAITNIRRTHKGRQCNMTGKIIYKDVENDEVIAARYTGVTIGDEE